MPEIDKDNGPDIQLCPAVRRLHELAWQPGEHLHEDWWQHLGLAEWRSDYRSHPGCRRALDALIVQRRGFPVGALPASLTEQQTRLIGLEERLPTLLVALGLFVRRQPDLLLLGAYRRRFAEVLGEAACEQLAALMPSPRRACDSVEPERAVDAMRTIGHAWLEGTLTASAVWQALSIRFSPLAARRYPVPDGPALPVLFRLERLL
jgi:hypothetical protein